MERPYPADCFLVQGSLNAAGCAAQSGSCNSSQGLSSEPYVGSDGKAELIWGRGDTRSCGVRLLGLSRCVASQRDSCATGSSTHHEHPRRPKTRHRPRRRRRTRLAACDTPNRNRKSAPTHSIKGSRRGPSTNGPTAAPAPTCLLYEATRAQRCMLRVLARMSVARADRASGRASTLGPRVTAVASDLRRKARAVKHHANRRRSAKRPQPAQATALRPRRALSAGFCGVAARLL
jgi:hypothetical protein